MSITIDSMESGLRHLKDTLSVACEIQFQLMQGETDDRVDSLLWIANDLAQAVYRFNEMSPEERARAGE